MKKTISRTIPQTKGVCLLFDEQQNALHEEAFEIRGTYEGEALLKQLRKVCQDGYQVVKVVESTPTEVTYEMDIDEFIQNANVVAE